MPDPIRPLDFAPATGPEPTLWETIGAAFQDAQVKNSDEERNRFGDSVNEAWEALRSGLGDEERQQLNQYFMASGRTGQGFRELDAGRGVMVSGTDPKVMRVMAMDAYRASLPEARRETVPTVDQLVERGREKSMARYYDAQDVLGRSPNDFGTGALKFAGAAAGAMTDPFNLVSLAVLRYPAQSVLATIGIEAAGGALTQALIEPQTYSYMNDLGIEYGLEDSVAAILQAGAGAGALGGLSRGLEKSVVRAGGNTPVDELRKKYKAQGLDPGMADIMVAYDRNAAESILRAIDQVERENPFAGAAGRADSPPDPAAAEAHTTETIRADETLMTGAPVTPARPGPAPELAPSRTPEGIELVDLASLRRDPMVFQFKDADMDGVTPALLGVDTWAPERASLIIAWERGDGTRYVVDGHQRHALAQRLTGQGHAPISAPVFLLRESDGVTSSMARSKAAMKNIGEGSGTALDAAWILREAPADEIRGLPPNSALVRAAFGLARLSDDAFGMVNNGIVDERWGALVGKMVDDRDVQAQVLAAVHRLDPQSPGAAESMIRDLMAAPRVQSETMDLFGAAQTTELLIAERARVKAAAMAQLGRNRSTFKVALQRQAELEAGGNRMAAEKNREALDTDTAAALRLEKDAHLKGWVSDALSQAARDLRNGSSLTEITGSLVESLRRGEGGGDPRRAAAGGSGRGDQGADAARQADLGSRGEARRGSETLKVDLRASAWRRPGNDVALDVHVNPTDAAIRRLSLLPAEARTDGKSTVALRYLRDAANNLYVWRGDLAIHAEVADGLKVTPHPEARADANGQAIAGGKVDVDDGNVAWDGLPDRPGAPVSRKALIDGGAIAWRRELIRPDAMTDDLERVLGWLSGQRKDVIEAVRESFVDAPAPAAATKADLMTELREAVRAHHVREAGDESLPPSLFEGDADVTRMRAAEDALRRPIADEGATIAAAADAEAAGAAAVKSAEDEALDAIEQGIRDLRKLEETDPRIAPETFLDPDTGKLRPLSDVLGEIEADRARVEVLSHCAFPGGRKGAA